MKIFIDTGAFVARSYSRNQYHSQAQKTWEKLADGTQQCYTSNLVIAETLSLIARWVGYSEAVELGYSLYQSEILKILRPESEDESNAINFLRKYSDQKVSFVDCISFVLMKRYNISQCFGYDHHFPLAGFKLWR